MAKIFLLCGKICSGKTYYARKFKEKYSAVILSTDEVTFDLIRNEQGEYYNVFAERVNLYLRKKAVEICKAGANVILDWGFWTNENRRDISDYLKENQVAYEWHYMDVPDSVWKRNIETRNTEILSGKVGSDFFVDEGLLQKLHSMFEVPAKDEIDVWYQVENR